MGYRRGSLITNTKTAAKHGRLGCFSYSLSDRSRHVSFVAEFLSIRRPVSERSNPDSPPNGLPNDFQLKKTHPDPQQNRNDAHLTVTTRNCKFCTKECRIPAILSREHRIGWNPHGPDAISWHHLSSVSGS